MRRQAIWILVFGLLTTGCGSATTSDAPYEPVLVDGRVEVEAVASFSPGLACGSALAPPGSPIPPVEPLDDDAQQALEALRTEGLEGEQFVADFEYGIYRRSDDELVLLGTSLNGSLSDALFHRIDGHWDVVGWGTCFWRADGYDQVKWQLDPDYQLDPESQTIQIVAVDNCGTVLDQGYEVVVVADFAPDSLTIEVWESLYPPEPGFSDMACPLERTVPLTVRLAEPIGNRAILGAYPSLDGAIGQ
jgi:hypothetical protein